MKHKALAIIGLIILVLVFVVIITFFLLSKKPAVPTDYTTKSNTGGSIEAKYLKKGSYEVDYMENGAMQNFKKYEIYYPKNIDEISEKLPAIIVCNGTGVVASKFPSLMEHLASWGFVVIATEEEYSWNGFGAEMCASFLERLNTNKEALGNSPNVLYQKIDMENVGLSGHSQGGVGVINAATIQPHKGIYKAIFAASPTNMDLANALDWCYDPSKLNTPIFMVSSTGQGDENLVVNLEGLQKIYNTVPASLTRIMSRHKDVDHGDMLYASDGYATAWFMWKLKGDEEAAKAFVTPDAEILSNPLYVDTVVSVGE